MHKIAKNLPAPFFYKLSALIQPLPLLSVRTYINFEIFQVFCIKKCGRSHLKNPLVRRMFALDKPPLP